MTHHPGNPTHRTRPILYTTLLLFGIPLLFTPIYLLWDPYQPIVDGLPSAIHYSYIMAFPHPDTPLPDSAIARIPGVIEGLLMGAALAIHMYFLLRETRNDAADDTDDTQPTINMHVLQRDD